MRLGRGARPAGPARRCAGRAPRRARPARRQVVWPVEREHWSDELPHARGRQPLRRRRRRSRAAPAPAAGEREAALVTRRRDHPPRRTSGDAPPAGAGGGAGHRARDARRRGAPLARLEHLAPDALAAAERGRDDAGGGAAPRVADPLTAADELLARGRAALAVAADARTRRALSLLLAERLIALGKQDDAVAVLGPPPHGDDEVGRYIAFRQVEAHARAGRRAELLAEAREVLHRRSRPRGRGRSGAGGGHGPRAAHAARVAGLRRDAGGARVARPAARAAAAGRGFRAARARGAGVQVGDGHLPLAATTTTPTRNRPLQHLARASVAAARAGDRAEFARTFRILAGQETSEPTWTRACANAIAPTPSAAAGPHRQTPQGRRADRVGGARPRARQAARGALGELAARAAGGGARRAARAGRERRPGEPEHAGGHAEASPGRRRAAAPSTRS